jgi:hypothetical protein
MTKLILRVTLAALLLPPLTAFAKLKETNPPRETIKPGTEISLRYQKESDTYEVTITHELGVGPNVATPEDLKEAISMEGSVTEFKKKMSHDPDAIFVLKNKLPLLWPVEIEKREKMLGKKKAR